MTSGIGPAPLLAAAGAPQRQHADDDIDSTLSSTTPDVPKRPKLLSLPHTLLWAGGLGVALGALLLRPGGAGFSLGALASGAWKGAAVGGGLGAALVGIDRATDGQVRRQLDIVGLDRRAQLRFVLSNPTRPWLAPTGIGVARDARAAQEQLYGRREPLDGPQDAFRHAYAAALFSLRAMRDHGEESATAHRLALEAGAAHETDGQDNNDEHSRAMDHANNAAGIAIIGDGRARAGEPADTVGFVTEQALRERVLDAMRSGQLELVDRTADEPSVRTSGIGDLPPNSGH